MRARGPSWETGSLVLSDAPFLRRRRRRALPGRAGGVGTAAAVASAADQRARAARPGSVTVRSGSAGSLTTETGEPGSAGVNSLLVRAPSGLRSAAAGPPASALPRAPPTGPARVRRPPPGPPRCSSGRHAGTSSPGLPVPANGQSSEMPRTAGAQGLGFGAASPDQRWTRGGDLGRRTVVLGCHRRLQRCALWKPDRGLLVTVAREANRGGLAGAAAQTHSQRFPFGAAAPSLQVAFNQVPQ